ncbi:MAG: helix-turn-helix domain-containing protein [Nitrospirota bacterium]|nr:helix-turn-helix domain-containing protein [Nitrospirota bacterium]
MIESNRIFPPSKYIKDALKERGWTQADLAFVLGRSPSEISFLLIGRKRMSPELAQELAVVLGNTADHWLGLDNAYSLSQTSYVDEAVIRRSRIFSFPIKEMRKRKWITETTKLDEMEDEFKRFFGVDSLAEDLSVTASYRRTIKESSLNNAEKAWIARAKQLAKVCPAEQFDDSNLANLAIGLRRLAAKSQAVHRVPALLSKYGIRFVVVEPLPRVQIDGAAFWLDDRSPVIAMSIRFDNIGSFWFTLMHEFFHIKEKDAFSFDDLQSSPVDDAEIRASRKAADILVPEEKLETFIRTHSPRYSEARINYLATQLEIHPGIIVGQLQHRKEIGYSMHRPLMTKVRELTTAVAFTDGWGHPVPQV